MLIQTLSLVFSLQSPIGEADVAAALQAAIDSARNEVAATFEPTLRDRRMHADPARVAVAARKGVSPSLFTSRLVPLPPGVATFDETAMHQCAERDRSGRSCAAQSDAYFITKAITATAPDELVVNGFLGYALSPARAAENGRARMFDGVRVVLRRVDGRWRVVKLGVLRAG
jgi:hypothetical protein